MIIGALLNKGDPVRFFLTAGSSIDQKLDVYHHISRAERIYQDQQDLAKYMFHPLSSVF